MARHRRETSAKGSRKKSRKGSRKKSSRFKPRGRHLTRDKLGNFSNPLKGMGTAISSRVAKAATAVRSASPSLSQTGKFISSGVKSAATAVRSASPSLSQTGKFISSGVKSATTAVRSASPSLSQTGKFISSGVKSAGGVISSGVKSAGRAVSSAGSRILSTAQGQGGTQQEQQQDQMVVAQPNASMDLINTGSDTVNMVPVSPEATVETPLQDQDDTQPISGDTSVGQNAINQKSENVFIRHGNLCYYLVPINPCPPKKV